MVKRILFIVAIVFVSAQVFSQSSITERADTSFNRKNFIKALVDYKNALKKEKKKGKKKSNAVVSYIDFRLAEIYRSTLNYKEAKNWYSKAIKDGYSEPIALFHLGDMFMMEGNYDEALQNFEEYIQTIPEPDIKVNLKMESCKFAMLWQEKKPKYILSNEKQINSKFSDYGPAQVGKKVIIASTRTDKKTKRYDTYTTQGFSDLYETSYDSKSSKWLRPTLLKGNINSKYNEGTLVFDYGHNTAYFMQCNGSKGKESDCNIYQSIYDPQKNDWSKPESAGIDVKEFSAGHPAINSNGSLMYFVSDMDGGEGGTDIWIVRKDSEGKWSSPTNAGKDINTKGNEMFPYLYDDTLLYFSSDGHLGFGGLDIFSSSISNQGFATPKNLTSPVNSSADDFGIIFLGIDSGMFCSNRIGGVGSDDIYSFRPIPSLSLAYNKQLLKTFGYVFDKTIDNPLNNALLIINGSDNYSDTTLTDTSGFYAFESLKPEIDYSVRVIRNNYLSDVKKFSTKNEDLSRDYAISAGINMNFELIKITREEIIIPNIYYDYNKFNLRDISKVELDKKVAVLKSNPDLRITIFSHTDERGADDYNLTLSEKRAQSVIDYFNKKGININRLSAKGMGESAPLFKDALTENEHQLNRRTSFIIENINDIAARNDSTLINNFSKRFAEKINKYCGANSRNALKPKEILEYRVLFAFSQQELVPIYYKEVEEISPESKVKFVKDGNYYRYTSGAFTTIKQAMEQQVAIKKVGLRSFIVVYRNDSELTLNEAYWLNNFKAVQNVKKGNNR